MRVLIDTTPLQAERTWRRLWVGTSLSTVGGQLTVVAVLYQVWQTTGSTAWVGALGLAQAVPRAVFGLTGGGLADRLDRRRLVLVTTAALIVIGGLLAAQALAGRWQVWVVFALVMVQAATAALGAPARRSFTARMLPREQVAAGIALDHAAFQAAMLVGPALAGLVIAVAGLGACYLLDVATFVAAMYGVAGLPSLPPVGDPPRRRGLIRAGLRYVVRRPLLRGALVTDLVATVLAMPVSLFPAINAERFGGRPQTLGLLLSAIAFGGILAGVASGLVTRAARPGAVMLGAVWAWGLGLAAFGCSPSPAPALAALAVAGAADTVSVIARGTVVQLATDDDHRGRVSSVELVVGAAGPDVGNLRGGLVAGTTTPAVAVVSGALACLAGIAAVTLTNRRLRRFTVRARGDQQSEAVPAVPAAQAPA